MTESPIPTIALVIVCIIVTAACCSNIAREIGRGDIRAQAVEHGYGEWVSDKYGNTQFRWKQQKASEE